MRLIKISISIKINPSAEHVTQRYEFLNNINKA